MAKTARLFWALLLATGILLSGGIAWAQDDDDTTIEEGVPGEEIPEDEDETTADKPKTAFPRRKPGEKRKKVLREDRDKIYSLQLPDDWVAERTPHKDAVLAFDLKLPGTTALSYLLLVNRENLGDPRTAPFRLRESVTKNFSATSTSVERKPMPQLVAHHERDGHKRVAAYAFKWIRGNSMYLLLQCPEAEWEFAKADFLAAAASIKTKAESIPAIPKDYKRKKKGRYLYVIHPRVKRRLTTAQKIVKAAEKRFVKFHGKVPPPPKGEYNVVFVHNDRSQAGGILSEVASANTNFFADTAHGALFIVPVAKGNIEEGGYLAGAVHALLYGLKYGYNEPRWIQNGERTVGRAEEMTTKPLPFLHAGMVNWRDKGTPGPLSGLEALRVSEKEEERQQFFFQSFFYSCFFRSGPPQYRKAYKKFFKEFGETLDWQAAYDSHIGSLDESAMSAKVKSFVMFELIPFAPK